ncbi:MAG: AAA family ATPase [Acidimicrobiia bacterium]
MSRLVLATADTEFEGRVRSAFKGEFDGQLRFWRDELLTDEPNHMIRHLAQDGVEVVALGPGLSDESAIELARAFDSTRPDISVVIVAEPSTDLLQSALHAGARDVIAPDAPTPVLKAAIERAFEAANARRVAFEADEAALDAPRVIATLCPKGGAGKTTVSSNLALGLAHVAPGEVVIVDLDLQFGDVASALGIKPEGTFSEAVKNLAKLDATRLKANLTHHDSGLFVLCAPATPTEVDDLTVEHVQKVLQLLTEAFRYVVVDTASGLDEYTLAALEYATDLIVLSATDIPSIRSTQKEIDALRVLGRPEQRWHFVLNRADAKTGLTIGAIETAVGVSVDVAIPSSRAVPLSLNHGTPVIENDPRAPVSLAMAQLVRRIAPQMNGNGDAKASAFWRRGK